MTGIKHMDLAKTWMHSHEEDRDGLEVYRPSTYPFPAARGRDAIELHAGGSLVRGIPGPDDRRSTLPAGSWTLEGKKLILRQSLGATREYSVESVEPDKLLLRPL